MTRDPPALRSVELTLIAGYLASTCAAMVFDAGWSDAWEALAVAAASVCLQAVILVGTLRSAPPSPSTCEVYVEPDGLWYEVERWPRLLARTWVPQVAAAFCLWLPASLRLERGDTVGVMGLCAMGCGAGLLLSTWLGGRRSVVRLVGHRLSVDGREVLLTEPGRQLTRVELDHLEARTGEGTLMLRAAPETLDQVTRLLEQLKPLTGDRSEVPRPLSKLRDGLG
ncbi:MAG: hypothetical protein KC621_31685 [Myxococcales bacterium]|nr:hypothetical protein [Myxococcales bacterium]